MFQFISIKSEGLADQLYLEMDQFYAWSYYDNKFKKISTVDSLIADKNFYTIKNGNDVHIDVDRTLKLARSIRKSGHPPWEYLSYKFFHDYRIGKLLVFHIRSNAEFYDKKIDFFKEICRQRLHNKIRCIIWRRVTDHKTLAKRLWQVEWDR